MMSPFGPARGKRLSFRTVFTSDTHLGTPGCRSDFLADFLHRTACDNLFRVGDIIDGWRLRRSWYWDETQDQELRLLVRHAEMRRVDAVLDLNGGDRVESCTALVEHHDGRLELIDWAALNRLSFAEPQQSPPARLA
jgi:UDP-2,3-diacylglucosamine pyrophosphatase LpxH